MRTHTKSTSQWVEDVLWGRTESISHCLRMFYGTSHCLRMFYGDALNQLHTGLRMFYEDTLNQLHTGLRMFHGDALNQLHTV